MAKTLQDFEKEQLKIAKQQQSDYASQKRALTNNKISQTVAALSAGAQPAIRQAKQQQAALPAKYQPQYDYNEIKRQVSARKIRESMANRGLHFSGTETAALAGAVNAQRIADTAVSTNKRKEETDISNKVASLNGNLQAKQKQQTANLRASAEKEILANEQSLLKAAKSRALTLYKQSLTQKKR